MWKNSIKRNILMFHSIFQIRKVRKVNDLGLILFGNKNVEFLLNTMTGIKYAVNSLGGVDEMFDLPNNVEAFKEINTFSFTQNIFEKENVK